MWSFFVAVVLIGAADGVAGEAGIPVKPLDPASYSPSRTVIVLSQNTQVFAGDKPIGTVLPGAVLRFTKVHEKWLMIPRYGGWVSADDVLPIEVSVQHYSSLIEKEPSAVPHLHRGIAYLQLGQLDEAQADFEQAIQLGTKDGAVYMNLATVLQRRGLKQESLLNYSKGIELSPDMALPYIERSSVLMEMGQFTEAAADLEKAISLEPTTPEAYNNRGVLLRMQSKYEESLADYTKAIELFGKYPAAYANRGFAHQQLGKYDSAIADYDKALTYDPISAEFANDAAWLLATCPDDKIRNPARAMELAESACKATNRENGTYLDTLAAAYAAAGKFEDAVKTGEEALKRLEGSEEAVSVHAHLELFRQSKPFVETLPMK